MTIQCDERGFDAGDARLRWDELLAVGIRTTSDGPFAADCFWQFLLRGGAVMELPAAQLDGEALERVLAELPGIDLREVVTAMGSVEERVFRVWHAEESAWQWDTAPLRARFIALVERLGGHGDRSSQAFARLETAWSAPHRRYHDREHLLDCLRELDGVRRESGGPASGTAAQGTRADVAELALWYHDAVYDPGRRDSEELSARLLLAEAAASNIPSRLALASAACVRATAHGAPRAATDRAADALHAATSASSEPPIDLVNDIDLAILGRDDLRFLEYEYSVEEEYAHVWSPYYFVARGRFLEALLAAPSIYRTRHFRARYEARARAHLEGLLASSRYRLHRWLKRARRCFGGA